MDAGERVLIKVFEEMFGELSDIDEAADLCNLIYHHTFGVKLPSGEVTSVSSSMRQAARLIEHLFKGTRIGLEKVTTPGYEYAYWLRFLNDPHVAEEEERTTGWLERLRRHPQIAFVQYSD